MPTSTASDSTTAILSGTATCTDVSVVGGKGAQTARLIALGLPVPPTGVVTVDAYRIAATDPVVAALIDQVRRGAAVDAEELDAAFLAARLPPRVAEEILRLGRRVAGEGRLAVRSSATVEDLGGTSFAGQYRSFLDIAPGPELLRAVRLVWASLWHPAPRAYRAVSGVDDSGAAMAVVLMAMVPAVEAGVVFTVDPAAPDGRIRVEAVHGVGEALVSGAVTPEAWSLTRAEAASAPPPVGPVVALALAAEDGFGVPLDVEWAWDGRRAWVVQARPITVAGSGDGFDTAVDDHVLTTAGIAEMLPGVLPPLVWQLAGTAVEEALRTSLDALAALDSRLVGPHGLVRRVRGRAALDLDALKAVAESLPGGSAEAVEHGFFGGVAPPSAPRSGRVRAARHDLRVDAARRRAVQDARVITLAADQLSRATGGLDELSEAALLGRRRRLIDLGFRAMAAELGVAAAATAAYDRVHAFVASHLPGEHAAAWTRRVTTGAGAVSPPAWASMSVFAGPTWEEAGIAPPSPPARVSSGDALADLEGLLRALPRWSATRVITGQVVDVRLHLLRRLVAEAVSLLEWRERAKGAVLAIGGLVRTTNLAVADRLVADGQIDAPSDVDLLSDAELRGADSMPSHAVIGRRRRELARMQLAGSLPERFSGVPPESRPPLPVGDRLSGRAASGGRVTARARVVRDPRTAKLRAGEVLVAESTDAGWSPLFIRAAAIVVERGGPLSHAAIIARELGIPAVLDVRGATGVLDGRMVTVDGDAGTVVLHGHRVEP